MNEELVCRLFAGEIEDICGQLGDVEGEHQKLVEECIEKLLTLVEPYKASKIWNEEYGFWEVKKWKKVNYKK